MSSNPNAGAQMYYIRQSDGLAYCFSPVPLISDSKESLFTIKDGVETRLGTRHTLTFNGTLIPETPALSGVNPDASCLELLDRKSDQLCSALDEDLGNLLIVDASGYPVLSVYPRVQSIDFPESIMVQRRDYTIVFEYEDSFEDDCKIENYQENWDFQYQEDDTISATHNLSAVGISDRPAGTGAVENAKYFVLQRANALDRTKHGFLTAPFVPAIIDIDNLTEYNHVRTESIDEVGGSYGITESWILSSGSFKDDRTVETVSNLDEFGDLIETVSVNGVVQGYGDTTFDRFDAAVAGFEGTVAGEIGFNATSGIVSKSRTDNRFAGTVSYAMEFAADDTEPLEGRTVQRSFQRNEDGTVSQTVTTTASVKQTSTSGIDAAIDFCFVNNFPIDNYVEPYFSASLSGNLESVSSERDDLNKTFSLTRIYREQGAPLYREEFQVNREQNVENALTTISVNGTVYGLGEEDSTSSRVRFLNASGAYFSVIEPLVRTRALALAPTGSCIGDLPISDTLGINEYNGIITYDFRYDNRFLSDNSNIRDEQIDVQYALAGDVIAEIPIPGKATGPILQDQETKTGLSKSLRITYSMAPSGTSCGPISVSDQRQLEAAALAESNILVNNTVNENDRGEKPVANKVFKVTDNYSFNRQSRVFSRNVTWKYTFN